MLTIKKLVQKDISKGFGIRDAKNLVAEEIIIRKIASSELSEHVTLKGGIIMYNLTKNKRRVTKDIDFDFIRYSLDINSISIFIDKMNKVYTDFKLTINGEMESLNQEDYHGVRVNLIISDAKLDRLFIKLDIGVHTYTAIEQDNLIFQFESSNDNISIKANPLEQIIAEKLISLSRLGLVSTRYKDLYDLYYLIKECNVSSKRVMEILELFFANSNKKPDNISELQLVINDTLNNESFAKEASNPSTKWIDDNYDTIKDVILNFVNTL